MRLKSLVMAEGRDLDGDGKPDKPAAAGAPAPRALRVVAPGSTAKAPATSGVGVFITPQSIMTFPVASGAVFATWKVFGTIFPAIATNKAFPLATSFLIGGVIFYGSLTPKMTNRDKAIGFLVALLNSVYLTASVFGISP